MLQNVLLQATERLRTQNAEGQPTLLWLLEGPPDEEILKVCSMNISGLQSVVSEEKYQVRVFESLASHSVRTD